MTTRLLFAVSLASMFGADIALAQQTLPVDRRAPGQPSARPDANRPSPGQRPGPVTKPSPGRPGMGPGNGGGQVRPPFPNRPDRPAVRPPGVTLPARPLPPHRPGIGRPPNFRPIQGNPFRYPRGYAYRRWVIGMVLPRLFFASPYYYDRFAMIGIGRPPAGHRWVRFGPDLLLVNVRTRRIVDAIYGAFY